jgi:hypothetical protein
VCSNKQRQTRAFNTIVDSLANCSSISAKEILAFLSNLNPGSSHDVAENVENISTVDSSSAVTNCEPFFSGSSSLALATSVQQEALTQKAICLPNEGGLSIPANQSIGSNVLIILALLDFISSCTPMDYMNKEPTRS